MYREILKNKVVVIFMRDQTSIVIVFSFTVGIVLTEEQIMAHHDFFIRRYNVDADPVK